MVQDMVHLSCQEVLLKHGKSSWLIFGVGNEMMKLY